MRLAFVALGFGKDDNLGGSAIVAAMNAAELAARGHEVVFFCTNKKDKSSELYKETTYKKINGVKVVYLKTYTISFWPGSFGPCYIPNLEKYLEKEGIFDIVNLNEYRSYLALRISKWAIKKKIPFTVQPQGTMITGGKNIIIKWFYDFFYSENVLGKSSMVIPVTNSEKYLAIKKGVKEKNIMVIPTGIDIENYRNIPSKGHFREKFNIPKEKKIVLFVGRLDPIKGIDILIEGYAGIVNEKRILVIIGPDHGYQDKVRMLIKKFKLDNKVLMTGAIPEYKDVLSAMNDANVIVVPSRAEAFGMVILEGAVLRKPMVISKNCNISDQFEDSALVTEIKSESIGEAINNILNDHAFGRDLGEKAYNKVVEKFQLSRVVDEFEILFSKLITADGR